LGSGSFVETARFFILRRIVRIASWQMYVHSLRESAGIRRSDIARDVQDAENDDETRETRSVGRRTSSCINDVELRYFGRLLFLNSHCRAAPYRRDLFSIHGCDRVKGESINFCGKNVFHIEKDPLKGMKIIFRTILCGCFKA